MEDTCHRGSWPQWSKSRVFCVLSAVSAVTQRSGPALTGNRQRAGWVSVPHGPQRLDGIRLLVSVYTDPGRLVISGLSWVGKELILHYARWVWSSCYTQGCEYKFDAH